MGAFRPSQRGERRWRLPAITWARALILGVLVLELLFLDPSSIRASTNRQAQQETVGAVITTWRPSTGCGKRPPIAAGTSGEGHLRAGALTRSYWLHVPRGYQPRHLYPLVLNFHGHGSTARRQEQNTGFSQLADSAGFLAAYPQGAIGPDGNTGWASGGPNKPRVNDVLFVSDLLTHLQSELCVDPKRIYATGFSNGGGMTSLLACEMASRIAAFAPVAGSYFPPAGGCHPGRAVAIEEFHGTADQVVPYAGRPRIHELAATDWLGQWAARDHCAPNPVRFYDQRSVIGLTWTGCANDAQLIHYRLIGGVHAWPGGNDTAHRANSAMPAVETQVSATSLIWRFFAAHTL